MWAVINSNTGEAIPVSSSERGAKNYATKHGYNWVGKICDFSWAVTCTAIKAGNKWVYADFLISTDKRG